MKLIKKIDRWKEFPGGDKQRIALFECPYCHQHVERTVSHGRRDRSCGCQRNKGELNGRFTHGIARTPIYNIWHTIRQRCENPRDKNFQWYGGRGIKLSEEWQDFDKFAKWCTSNGWQKGLKLDRKDNDGPYSPDNCEFTTNQLNCQHSRRAKINLQTASEIKRMLATASPSSVATSLKISIHIVQDISRGRTWKNA